MILINHTYNNLNSTYSNIDVKWAPDLIIKHRDCVRRTSTRSRPLKTAKHFRFHIRISRGKAAASKRINNTGPAPEKRKPCNSIWFCVFPLEENVLTRWGPRRGCADCATVPTLNQNTYDMQTYMIRFLYIFRLIKLHIWSFFLKCEMICY